LTIDKFYQMETTVAYNIDEIFETQVNAFEKQLSGKPLKERAKDLKKIENWIINNSKLITDALYQDVGKPENEALLSEIKTTLTEIKDNLKHLKKWNEDVAVMAPASLLGTRSYVKKQPKGVVLIIAPWNFPFQLTIIPFVSAIAAGCKVVLKPSEFAPATANVIEKMVGELFEKSDYCAVQGEVDTAKQLLSKPFNHIFFTGSPIVGKSVMKAAAEHLTSITLELGGCNPLIVLPNANMDDACTKIAWGKLINAGQSCVSPNLIFVSEQQKEGFIELLKAKITSLYGMAQQAEENGEMAKIINAKHFKRIKGLIDDAINNGAKLENETHFNEETNFMAPVILSNIHIKMEIVKEEIFGPVFPIITYKTKDEIKQYLKHLATPLAFYVFGSEKEAESWVNESRAGTTAINETTIQVSHPELPFGGCNTSGIGKCHGYYGFREFINERSVLVQPVKFYSAKVAYPPGSVLKNKLIKFLTFNFR
jgi:aldehyde dehydrogenase (NAD+)